VDDASFEIGYQNQNDEVKNVQPVQIRVYMDEYFTLTLRDSMGADAVLYGYNG